MVKSRRAPELCGVLARVAVTVAFVVAAAACTRGSDDASSEARARSTTPAPTATTCAARAIATTVQDVFGLVNARRFDEAARPWGDEPLPGGPGALFSVTRVIGGAPVGGVGARRRSELPTALRRWVGARGSTIALETVVVSDGSPGKPNLGLTWTRKRPGAEALHGVSKGVWDCAAGPVLLLMAEEMPQMAERGGGPCTKPITTLERKGMRTRVCDRRS